MKVLGLDIASTTGWSVIEDGSLIDYGSIIVDGRMDLPQRLHYFQLELTRVIQRFNPDYCYIEDVLLGLSGVKILSYLSRLNGVAIVTAYNSLQERVKLYQPTYWKSNSLPGLNGSAKKWEVQLAVVKYFRLPITGNFQMILDTIHNQENQIGSIKQSINDNRILINKHKSKIARKRNPPSEDDKQILLDEIKKLELSISNLNKDKKIIEKSFDKIMNKVSVDISAQTGMTPDICDSCGIAICGILEHNNNDH